MNSREPYRRADRRRHTVSAACLGVLLGVAMLAGCASAPKPQLTPPVSMPPGDIDLSGRWLLRDRLDDPLRELTHQGFIGTGAAGQVIRLSRARSGQVLAPARESGRRNRHQAALVQVFLETGADVKITQTVDGLFISFDRSIVEEYVFGEHRAASVGPVIAERVSGWEDDAYRVETLDEDGVLLTERWYLDAGGQVLQRDVAISEDAQVQFAVTQIFDRVD